MAVGSVRSPPWSEIRQELTRISLDFHDLPSIFATKFDCQLVQVFVFVVVVFAGFFSAGSRVTV